MKQILFSSSFLILLLLALRAIFRNTISRRLQYALWALVMLRLLIPFSLPSSLWAPVPAPEPAQISYTPTETGTPPAIVTPQAPPTWLEQPQLSPSIPIPTEPTPLPQPPSMTVGSLLTMVWIFGMAVVGCWVLVSNVRFGRMLRKSRTPVQTEPCGLPVYLIAEGLPSPCLFGLLHPAIYVTPRALASPDMFHHVLLHEQTHAKHKDLLWSALRCLCLTIYWFHPLVWVAAHVSKIDCELACDESVLTHFTQAQRIHYGKTLLALIPCKGSSRPLLSATTMISGKQQLKDRIRRIAAAQKTVVLALAAVLVVTAAGCTVAFTKPKKASSAVPAPVPAAEMPEAVPPSHDPFEGAVPLTGAELQWFNNTFFQGGTGIPSRFILSIYERPEEIDFFELLYLGLPEDIPWTAEEETALHLTDSPGAVQKLPPDAIDRFFCTYTGLHLEESEKKGLEKFQYSEQFNTYYHSYGDTNAAPVRIRGGLRQDDTLYLFHNQTLTQDDASWMCLTLQEVPGDPVQYHFVSNVPYAGFPPITTLYPDMEPDTILSLEQAEPVNPVSVAVTHVSDDLKTRFSSFRIRDNLIVSAYHSTDGHVYAAVVRDDSKGHWEADRFYTFPDGIDFTQDISIGHQGRNISSFVLFGQCGIVICRPDTDGSAVYDYYLFDEDGMPQLWLTSCALLQEFYLDGDDIPELAAAQNDRADLFFLRDNQLYHADIPAILQQTCPERSPICWMGWDENYRCLISNDIVTVPQEAQMSVPPSAQTPSVFLSGINHLLYFDGENLLLYETNLYAHTDGPSPSLAPLDKPADVSSD